MGTKHTTASARYESRKWMASTMLKEITNTAVPSNVTEMGFCWTTQEAFSKSSSDCSEDASLISGIRDRDVIVSVGAIDIDMTATWGREVLVERDGTATESSSTSISQLPYRTGLSWGLTQ